MRFTSPAMTSALRAAVQNPARMTAQKQTLGGIRHYASQAQSKKGGSKLLFATLLGAGVVGGLAYNSSQTKVIPVVDAKEKPTAFNPDGFISLKLLEVETVSHDTKLFRFAIPEGTSAGLPVASCVMIKHQEEGKKPIIRPYTPVSDQHAEGHVDFIIKKYETGKLTPVIHDMKPGDALQFKGPIVKYDWETKQKSNVGMVAGGSGITPMLQVVRRVFDEKSTDKKTKVTLIFANRTEDDILCREELDKIAKQHPDRFKIIYALDRAPEKWEGLSGYVTKEVVEKYLPGPKEDDSIIMVCGPPPMVRSLAGDKDGKEQGQLSGILKEMGYSQENVFKF